MKKLFYSLIFGLAFAPSVLAATITAATQWDVRPTATSGNVNGGGFDPAFGGTDYSQQNAAQLHNTDFATSGAGVTTLTSAAGGFTSQMVGNLIHIVSGTGFTAGWYQITAFTDANTVTLNASPTPSGAGSGGSGYVGGAMSLGSTLDDAFFEAIIGGNTVWIKAGSYTFGQSVSVASSSAANTANIFVKGYSTSHGDTVATYPLFLGPIIDGGTSFNFASNFDWQLWNIGVMSQATPVVSLPADCRAIGLWVCNYSTVAGRIALSTGYAQGCELISEAGYALSLTSNGEAVGNTLHDSDVGILPGGGATMTRNQFYANKTDDIQITSTTPRSYILANTFAGRPNSALGSAVRSTGATATGLSILNNGVYRKTDGFKIATVQQDTIFEDYNQLFGVTTPRTLIASGTHSGTANPSFINFAEISGTTATTSGSVLTQPGGDMSAVVDGSMFLHVVSGTGVTVGIDRITAHTSTTVTVDHTLGTSSAGDVNWFIITGNDLTPTGAW